MIKTYCGVLSDELIGRPCRYICTLISSQSEQTLLTPNPHMKNEFYVPLLLKKKILFALLGYVDELIVRGEWLYVRRGMSLMYREKYHSEMLHILLITFSSSLT